MRESHWRLTVEWPDSFATQEGPSSSEAKAETPDLPLRPWQSNRALVGSSLVNEWSPELCEYLVFGVMDFINMLLCVSVVLSVRSSGSRRPRQPKLRARRVDTGPVMIIMTVCSDDDKGTSHPKCH